MTSKTTSSDFIFRRPRIPFDASFICDKFLTSAITASYFDDAPSFQFIRQNFYFILHVIFYLVVKYHTKQFMADLKNVGPDKKVGSPELWHWYEENSPVHRFNCQSRGAEK